MSAVRMDLMDMAQKIAAAEWRAAAWRNNHRYPATEGTASGHTAGTINERKAGQRQEPQSDSIQVNHRDAGGSGELSATGGAE